MIELRRSTSVGHCLSLVIRAERREPPAACMAGPPPPPPPPPEDDAGHRPSRQISVSLERDKSG